MKKVNRLVITLLSAMTLMFGITTNVMAVTPHYKSWVPDIPKISWDSLSQDSKDIIDNAVDEAMNNLDFDINIEVLAKPKITEANYRHSRVFWDPSRLQIRWNDVKNSDYYEIEITKTDGTSRIYTTDNNSLIIHNDDFVSGCVRSSTVRVRACSYDDQKYSSSWSDVKNITCNSLHRS